MATNFTYGRNAAKDVIGSTTYVCGYQWTADVMSWIDAHLTGQDANGMNVGSLGVCETGIGGSGATGGGGGNCPATTTLPPLRGLKPNTTYNLTLSFNGMDGGDPATYRLLGTVAFSITTTA